MSPHWRFACFLLIREGLVANEFEKGTTFIFNPRGFSVSTPVSSNALLANFQLSYGNTLRDVLALLGFIIAALCSTFAVLYNSKFRR